VASAVNARVIVGYFGLILGILMFTTPLFGDVGGANPQTPNEVVLAMNRATRGSPDGRGGQAQSVARSMTASQWDSVGRVSPGVTAAGSEGDRPFSRRSVIVGFADPEDTCVRGAAGGQVVPLLNMGRQHRHESGQG
jgi:hypothetical protein